MTGPRHQTMGTYETGTVDNICPRNAVSVQAVDVIGSRYMRAFSRFKGSGSFVAWGASEARRRQRRLDPALGRRRRDLVSGVTWSPSSPSLPSFPGGDGAAVGRVWTTVTN